ncbi:MAG: hypothetical protein HGB12_17225, partial [Bacteroidetes bacterium]|nr:hypothetical protein [Bacteroidota bacterium]
TTAHDYVLNSGSTLINKVNTNHKNTKASNCEKAQITKWIDTGAN